MHFSLFAGACCCASAAVAQRLRVYITSASIAQWNLWVLCVTGECSPIPPFSLPLSTSLACLWKFARACLRWHGIPSMLSLSCLFHPLLLCTCRLWFVVREYHDFVAGGAVTSPIGVLVFAASTMLGDWGVRPLPAINGVTIMLARWFTLAALPKWLSRKGHPHLLDLACVLGFGLWMEYVSPRVNLRVHAHACHIGMYVRLRVVVLPFLLAVDARVPVMSDGVLHLCSRINCIVWSGALPKKPNRCVCCGFLLHSV